MVVGDVGTLVDVVVLGAGPGGYVAAIRAAQLGKDVVLVDPGPVGGTCLNEGCIPSKALLTASERFWQLQHLPAMGITVEAGPVDFAKMQQWKDGIVTTLTGGVEKLLRANKVEVVQGKGWFINDTEMRVEGEYGALKFFFESVVIAVGGEAAPLAGLAFDGKRMLTPNQALGLKTLPENLAVIGADYIALEIATIYAKLGVPVRLVIPPGQQILDTFEPTAGRQVAAQLKKLGVTIERDVADPAAAVTDAATVVVSAGLVPRTPQLHLDSAGIMTDAHGFIVVNDRLQSSNPTVYAVGDVIGGPALATVAMKQGKVAAEALAGLPAQYAPQAIPHVAWTDPEVAAVGLTTAQAEAAGYTVVTGRFPLGANGRALTLHAPTGVVFTIAEKSSEVLLGVTIVAPGAADLIGEAALALEMGATLTDLAETLHPHPGLSEALQESAEVALGRVVHLLR